jgi:hypothetical protein
MGTGSFCGLTTVCDPFCELRGKQVLWRKS